MARIVLFGATGYTGKLTAQALVARGEQPMLAGRSAEKLERLAAELGGGLETAVANVADPASVRALLEAGDVMLTTVGPFARWGDAAAEAAVETGAHYLDSTGEPAFIRRVFEHYGPGAQEAGIGMLTAFGYDWVPGNLAGALALREAGEAAVRVDTGYFALGGLGGPSGPSGGTRASMMGAMIEPGYVWRQGIKTERGAARVRTFELGGKRRQAISAASSEHFALPRSFPQLREVNSYLGWFGNASRAMQAMSAFNSGITRIPGVRAGMLALAGRVKGSTGGPDETARAASGSAFIGLAYDGGGTELARVELKGPNGYDFTAGILAWGAVTTCTGGLKGAGALGPVEAFGLDELEAGCAEAGLRRAG
jgi:short subunit dehydrogenase-like uncharacterized protein